MKRLLISSTLVLCGSIWIYYCNWKIGLGVTALWWGTLIMTNIGKDEK